MVEDDPPTAIVADREGIRDAAPDPVSFVHFLGADGPLNANVLAVAVLTLQLGNLPDQRPVIGRDGPMYNSTSLTCSGVAAGLLANTRNIGLSCSSTGSLTGAD